MSEQINFNSVRPPTALPPAAAPEAVAAPKAVQSSAQAVQAVEEKADTRFDRRMELNVSEAVERLNEQMRRSARGLNFSVDKVADRTVITVKDTHSGEVVRQIPDEALLRVAHNIEEIKGLLYNDVS
jgi:flagellar protein FlaG